MKRLSLILVGLLSCVVFADSGSVQTPTVPRLKIQTLDATVANRPLILDVSNGTLTDNGDGSMTLVTGSGGGGGAAAFSLAITTGPSSTYSNPAISSSNVQMVVVFNQSQFNLLTNGATLYLMINTSSATFQGPIVSSITLAAMYGAPTLTGTNITALVGANIASGIPSSVLPSTVTYKSIDNNWSNAQTSASSWTYTNANGISVTYNVNAGSTTGSGLTSCSANTNALTWNNSTNLFGCNSNEALNNIENNWSHAQTSQSSWTITNANGLAVTYNVNAGSTTGSGLSSCSGASNALTWSNSTNLFGCNSGFLTANQSITLSGDASGSGTTAITVTNSALQTHITTLSSSFTVTNAALLGNAGNTVTVSSNLVIPGDTFYVNAPSMISSTFTLVYDSTNTAPLGVNPLNQVVVQSPSNVQVFTANGTWTKPFWAKFVRVVLVGGGGGGGGGKGAVAAAIEGGGGGGGGGAWCERNFLASDLGATVSVTISTGGAVAAGGASANGAQGNGAAPTTFGTTLSCYGGGGGVAGQATDGTGGAGGGTGGEGPGGGTAAITGGAPTLAAGTNQNGTGGTGAGAGTGAAGRTAEWGGGAGGGESGTAGAAGKAGGGALYGAGGGGGGGSCQAASQFAGGAGGTSNSFTTGGGGAGGNAGSNAGTAGANGSSLLAGAGGGGGGCSITVVGGAGNSGGVPGGGGGGGGSGVAASGTQGGQGGAGGTGEAWIYSW